MSFFKNITLYQKQLFFGGVAVASIAGLAVISGSTMAEIQVNGPLYQRITQNQAVVADYAPPSVMDAFLTAQTLANELDVQKTVELVQKGNSLRKDFEKECDHLREVLPPGRVREGATERVCRSGLAFFDARDRDFVPSLSKGDPALVKKSLSGLHDLYVQYDQAVAGAVADAAAKAGEEEKETARVMQSRMLTFHSILAASGLLLVALSLLFARDFKRRLGETMRLLARFGQGDFSEKLDASAGDEIGDLARATNAAFEMTAKRERAALEETHKEQASELVREVGSILDRVAGRDLTVRASGAVLAEQLDEHGERLAGSINAAIVNIDEALSQVSSASEQVSAAAAEISAGGQSLARASSRNAGAIEEVTSSLQEMVSMAQQNSTHAQEAKSLAEAAQVSAERGAENMLRLSQSVEKIKGSADATAKIVKTIDDIAFQTNLLALNAAVEAARAGDAGRGFAVVAEEVRNLAMRSAEAAKNTSTMIEGSVRNADEGVSLNREVLSNLGEITSQVRRVVAVMAEIAAASEQQRLGASQINHSVEQMSTMTQQNAATSEESASTSEELASQARTLLDLVSGFRLTHGAGRSPRHEAVVVRSLPPAMPKSNGHSNGHGSNGHGSNGHGSNGHGSNGHGSNGHGSNGGNGKIHANGHSKAAAKAFIPFDEDGSFGEF